MFGVDWLGSRRVSSFATAALISIGVGGCSSDMSTRFAQDSFFGNPYGARPEATGTVAPGDAAPPAAPYGRIESRPMPHYSSAPAISAPRSYPSAAAGSSGGGRGVASYTPPAAPRIEPAPAAAPRSVAAVTGSTAADSRRGTTTIIVGTGDTLDGLARRYNVSTAAILAANGYRGPRALQPGQQLVIPRQGAAAPPVAAAAAPKPAAATASVHYVNHGDTLYNIARRHQIPVTDLAAANGLATDARLKVGSRLTIPAGGAQAAAAQPAAQSKPAAVAQLQAPAPAVAAPVQKANLATATDTPKEAEIASPVKSAESTGALPSFRWPVRGRVIAGYGAKSNGKQNDGINLAVPEGTPVKAAEDGVVAYAGSELKGYGNLVLIRHDNGYVTAYAHASELKVKRGDRITRGQVIGKAGQTGDVDSPQLHFEIRKGSSPVDPMQFLSGA